MNWQVIKFKIYWWSKKIILNSLFFLIVFLVFGFALLQLPSVQTALTSRMLSGFSRVSGFEVTYDKFYLLWYDRLEIEGLKILDPEKNIMIGVERLQLNFTFSRLWDKNQIHVDGATIKGRSGEFDYVGCKQLQETPQHQFVGGRDYKTICIRQQGRPGTHHSSRRSRCRPVVVLIQ